MTTDEVIITEEDGFNNGSGAELALEHVSQVFTSGPFWNRSENVAVNDVTFKLSSDPSLITAVAGESGSGKTTLGRIMLGFQRPTSGAVTYGGLDIARMGSADRKQFRREVQAIFQDPYSVYNPFYKVDHIFMMAIKRFGLATSRDESRYLIEDAISKVGLRPAETLGRYPHQLSGGQRQRVMVARALLLEPKVIIADEPVSMVDASLRATILETLRTLNHELGIAILYITHDLTTAYQVADNILIMYLGHVVEAGEVENVINDPKHPYTQLLVQSIPMPDPNRRWADTRSRGESPFAGETIRPGVCPFVNRCPDAMTECRDSLPDMYQTNSHRIDRCYLDRDSGVAGNPEISAYFRRRDPKPTPTGLTIAT